MAYPRLEPVGSKLKITQLNYTIKGRWLEPVGSKLKINQKRRQQGLNLRGHSPTDFKSVSLTTRTYRQS